MKNEEKEADLSDDDSSEIPNIWEGAHLDLDRQKPDVEIQKYMLDASPIELTFYQAFSGWHKVYKVVEVTKPTGEVVQEKMEKWAVNMNTRQCGEACSTFLTASINALIFQLTTTSKLKEEQIAWLWDGKLRSIEFVLTDNFYGLNGDIKNKNSFKLANSYAITEIITTLATLVPITYKALDGFTTTQITETIVTQMLKRNDIAPKDNEKSGLIRDTINKILK